MHSDASHLFELVFEPFQIRGRWKKENGRWKTEQAPFIPRIPKAASVVWISNVGVRGATTKRIKHVVRISFCVLSNEGCIAQAPFEKAYVLYLKIAQKTERCKHDLTNPKTKPKTMSSTVSTVYPASTDCPKQSFTFDLDGETHVVAGITIQKIPKLVELVMNAQDGNEVAKEFLMHLAGNTEVISERQELLERLGKAGFEYAKNELKKQKTGECVIQRAKEMGLLK